MGKRTVRSMSVGLSKETQITWQQYRILSTANARGNPNGQRSKNCLVPISIGLCQEDVCRAFCVLLVPHR